jgi:hypothetical protein
MSSSTSPTRRNVLVASAAADAAGPLPTHLSAATDSSAIRPLSINVPEEALLDLRRRIAATLLSAGLRAAFRSLRPAR